MDKVKTAKSVYHELGFPDADEMLLKAQLAMKIAEILRQRGWSQQRAAKVLGCGVKIVVGPEGQRAAGRVEVVAA